MTRLELPDVDTDENDVDTEPSSTCSEVVKYDKEWAVLKSL